MTYPNTLKRSIIYLTAFIVALTGLYFTRNAMDSELAIFKLQKEKPLLNYEKAGIFSFGFKTLIADILYIKLLTSYPINKAGDFFDHHNIYIKKARTELISSLPVPQTVQHPKTDSPKPTAKAAHHDDEDEHTAPMGRLLEKFGFFIETPDEEAQTHYDNWLIQEIYYQYLLLFRTDPRFLEAYNMAFVFFSLSLGRPDLSYEILGRGIKANPGNRQLILQLATNAELFDYKTTETLAQLKILQEEATGTDNALFIARLIYSIEQSRNPYYIKIFLLKQLYPSQKDQDASEKIKRLMINLTMESTLLQLNNALPLYLKLQHREPTTPFDLAGANILDPFTQQVIKNSPSHFKYLPGQGFIINQ